MCCLRTWSFEVAGGSGKGSASKVSPARLLIAGMISIQLYRSPEGCVREKKRARREGDSWCCRMWALGLEGCPSRVGNQY